MRLLVVVFIFGVVAVRGEIPAWTVGSDFESNPILEKWIEINDIELFSWNEADERLEVTWDSSKPNSFFALPLGFTLTRADDFSISFSFRLESIEIGTTPEKPYTFQIAAGLINLTNATSPDFLRGSGINAQNGPRNLVEWTYFPDSGFGATVGPTLVSRDNQIAFSANYPLTIQPGVLYSVVMSFSSLSQTLQTQMWADGEPFGLPTENTLHPLTFPSSFSDFRVNAFAISSYHDAGQEPPEFAGSILASGFVDDVGITVLNRPPLTIQKNGSQITIRFPTESGWVYWIESSVDSESWTAEGGLLNGSGVESSHQTEASGHHRLFRVRAVRDLVP